MPTTLKSDEFYTVYGVSLACTKSLARGDLQYLASLLQPVADKYVEISLKALRAELRYFRRGDISDGETCDSLYLDGVKKQNLAILKKFKIKDWRKERLTIPIDTIIYMFEEGWWNEGVYGGEAWGKIAKAVKALQESLPVTGNNLAKVCSCIDRLNDLEHNNSLYLRQYCAFDLALALIRKSDCTEKTILSSCPSEIKFIYNEVL